MRESPSNCARPRPRHTFREVAASIGRAHRDVAGAAQLLAAKQRPWLYDQPLHWRHTLTGMRLKGSWLPDAG